MSATTSVGDGLRVQFTEGGDPGPEVVAAVTALLTRPVVVVEESGEDAGEDAGPTPWIRAARLEGIVHGRRITTRADLRWRGAGRGSA